MSAAEVARRYGIAQRVLRRWKAKQIYYQHRDDKLEGGATWKSRLFNDFAEMRTAGLKHGLMVLIEREIGADPSLP